MDGDAWTVADPTLCDVCGRESCEDHLPTKGIPGNELEDAVDVAQEGRDIAAHGVRYVVDKLVPNYGLLGFLVAFAKVGKTTFGQDLSAAVANGRAFLDRPTVPTKVLVMAAEDPPEYTAFLARHLDVTRGQLLFRRKPLTLGTTELQHICATVEEKRIGLVLIASWQAVIRGLVKDENDNAGAVQIVERVKAAARRSGVPWLIDAHSGKGEDQSDEADPSRAMRGASAAAGAADFTLSLRYANGTFGTQRRLSGKGRFVSFAPLTLEFDPSTNRYTVSADGKSAAADSTWRLICETGALTETPRSANDIARACGLVTTAGKVAGTHWRQVTDALRGRLDVGRADALRRGQKTVLYRRLETV